MSVGIPTLYILREYGNLYEASRLLFIIFPSLVFIITILLSKKTLSKSSFPSMLNSPSFFIAIRETPSVTLISSGI